MSIHDYDFAGRRFQVRPGITMHYLDEGPRKDEVAAPEVVVMLHGNPSWSYYWRRLVRGLRDRYRCIVPDHVGMGLSDRPDDGGGARPPRVPAPGPGRYDYTLHSRVQDLEALLEHLRVDGPVTLVVHDWGGMIGMGWALPRMARVRRLVVLNTALFPMPAAKSLPWQLWMGRDSGPGAWCIRRFNLFARGAARLGVARPMPGAVRRAYVAPYRGWDRAIATVRFMQDIPLGPGDRAWPLVEESGRRLQALADRPVFVGWGLRDFVFDRHCLAEVTRALPAAQVHAFEDAGHYVLEDRADVLVPAIRHFLDANPVAG